MQTKPFQRLTKSQVNKAGKVVRRFVAGEGGSPVELRDAIGMIDRYRAAHQYPLTKATMGLRSMVKSEKCTVEVSQRLKRLPTIVGKLVREPTMQLSTMQDIGGCRAVLDTIDQIRRVERRLKKNRTPIRVSDYIASPRESGYRGVHVVVCYDERAIEVQLRTRVMHEWAIAVERFSGRIGQDLKSGRGPEPVLNWLEAVSEAMAIEEGGEDVSTDLLGRIEMLRGEAVPFLQGGGG